jgi:hypothetical protein
VALDALIGRIARLPGSPLEGPESGRKPAFQPEPENGVYRLEQALFEAAAERREGWKRTSIGFAWRLRSFSRDGMLHLLVAEQRPAGIE